MIFILNGNPVSREEFYSVTKLSVDCPFTSAGENKIKEQILDFPQLKDKLLKEVDDYQKIHGRSIDLERISENFSSICDTPIPIETIKDKEIIADACHKINTKLGYEFAKPIQKNYFYNSPKEKEILENFGTITKEDINKVKGLLPLVDDEQLQYKPSEFLVDECITFPWKKSRSIDMHWGNFTQAEFDNKIDSIIDNPRFKGTINMSKPKEEVLDDTENIFSNDLHAGKKETEGKLDYSEINFELLDLMAERFAANKGKYKKGNTKKPIEIDSLLQAAFRHLRKMMQPLENDPEKFEDHLAAVATNLSIILDQKNLHKSN